ncbi:MAG: hypothetical protein AB8H79_04425 [Myxococcota bacterium]
MRPFLCIPLLIATQACLGTVCLGQEEEFVLNDEVTPAGIRPSEAMELVPENYTAQASNDEGETGDVQIEILPRTGDPVHTTVLSRGPDADQQCGTGHLSLPVTIEMTTWFGGTMTLAANRLFWGRESPWNTDLSGTTLIDAQGFGEHRGPDGELLDGYVFDAGFARDSHSEWGGLRLFEPKRQWRSVLDFERQVVPDEEDW